MERKNIDVVFIVLHYMAEETTINCVEKLKEKIDTNNYKIVIVDNASTNGSGKNLMARYEKDDFIRVLLNDKNLGFAKGNNIGFKYAKDYFSPKFIVLMNNDVFLVEDALMNKISHEYEKCNFAVLGPLIMTKDGMCDVNPMNDVIENKSQIIKRMKLLKRMRFLKTHNLFFLYETIANICNFFIKKKKQQDVKNYMERKYNVQLHGCFLVFSEKYIERFDGLDDRTFLYMEEDILYKHMKENQLTTVYVPNIIVYHEEDVSTNSLKRTEKEKMKFKYNQLIDSCNILLEVYEDYEKQKM